MKKVFFYPGSVLSIFFWAILICGCQKEFGLETVRSEKLESAANREFSITSVLTPETPFTVMSFNLRNDPREGSCVPPDPFNQAERMTKLTEILSNHNVDILGVQELSNDDNENYVNNALDNAGYSVYKAGASNGSPKSIFYKRSRFELINAGNFLKKFTESIISSAKWVILRDILYDRKYFIINSHWYHASDGAAYRKIFARMLVDTIKARREGLPVICIGDFNAVPGTDEIDIIKDADGLNMVDGLMDSKGAPTFHKWTGTGTRKLDYIVSTRDLSFTNYKVVEDYFTVNGNTMWPSDHFPVFVRYLPAIFRSAKIDLISPGTSAATQYYFADTDGDGRKDKIKWTPSANSGKINVYLSTGDGYFSSTAVTHTASVSTSELSNYYFADVNGDGKADMIKWNRNQNGGRTQVYLATSNGQFSSTVINNNEGYSDHSATRYYFADVNGDGKADKVKWNPTYDSGNIRIHIATGNGLFSGTVNAISTGRSTKTTTNYYFADINGDGKADLIKWNYTEDDGKTMVYLANSGNGFTISSGFSNSGALSALSSTVFNFEDINGDGKADKVYWNRTNYLGKPRIYFAGSSSFDGAIHSLRGTSESSNTHFYYADINGDGKADKIRWNPSANSGEIRNYLAR